MRHGPIALALPDFDLSVRLLSDALRRAGERDTRRAPLELDLAGVPFLTAAALGRLVALRNRLDAMGGRLALLNVGPAAHKAIEAANLSGLLGARRAG